MNTYLKDSNVPLGAILVGLDDSPESARALSWAAEEARRRNWPLHLMHVLDNSTWLWSTWSIDIRPAEPVLREALVMLDDWSPAVRVTWSQPVGDPATLLARGARAARLTVVGSRGRGAIGELVMGSVATQLISLTRCPVAVLRSGTPVPAPDAPVVAGVQYGRPFAPVLDAAFEEADRRGVELVVVHAWQLDASTIVDGVDLEGLPPEEAQQREMALLTRNLAEIARSHPDVEVTVHAERDGTAESLARYSTDAALLVIGSRGRSEIGGVFLGSVSQRMVRSANCPVLVVRDGRPAITAHYTETATGTSS